MKVLMALHNYPPEFTGGVERSVVVLARELVKRGHELRILAGSERRRPVAQLEQEEHEGILVHRFHRAEGYINPVDLHDPLADAAVENLLAGFRPDLVHVHHWYGLTTGLVGLAALDQRGQRQGIGDIVTRTVSLGRGPRQAQAQEYDQQGTANKQGSRLMLCWVEAAAGVHL